MPMFRTALALAALAYAGDAVAQTSTCTSIGGGMVHCDNMGPNGTMSSTNCTDLGGGMSSCNTSGNSQPNSTPDMSHPQTNGSTLNFIGGLIAHSRERSLEKKLGHMIASGDCEGAATYAYLHSRNDLAEQIHRTCQPSEAAVAEMKPLARREVRPASLNTIGTTSRTAAFNLLCQGTEISFSKMGDKKEVTYSNEFRIDLASLRYCEGNCAATLSIANVEPAQITFKDNISKIGRASCRERVCLAV